jgi:hypothetical protein
MRARVLPFNIGREGPENIETHAAKLEVEINKWLDKADVRSIDRIVPIGDRAGALVVFYTEGAETAKARPTQPCTQCRKKPPLPDLKICEACRDYQADYRKKRKAESKVRYP